MSTDGVTAVDHQTFSHQTPTEFYTAEANRIHELCDAAGVLRTIGGPEGVPLSLSQRVEFLMTAYADLLKRSLLR